MKFGELMKVSKPDLVVSPRYDAWMKENSNPTYSDEALKHGVSELEKQAKPRDRRGSYSASSLNSCMRRQQFTFIGMPALPPTPKTAAIFQNGTFMHIRWQMAGLTEGFFREVEVPVPDNALNLNGTRDAVAHDGTVVELKSINHNGFGQVSTFGPKEDHIAQVGTYAAAAGHEKAVIIYEDKDTQEYREFVIKSTELPVSQIAARSRELWDRTRAEELAEPLEKCIEKTGYRYTGCPYREQCLDIHEWDEAKELST